MDEPYEWAGSSEAPLHGSAVTEPRCPFEGADSWVQATERLRLAACLFLLVLVDHFVRSGLTVLFSGLLGVCLLRQEILTEVVVGDRGDAEGRGWIVQDDALGGSR